MAASSEETPAIGGGAEDRNPGAVRYRLAPALGRLDRATKG
jgi:hypothetical protein